MHKSDCGGVKIGISTAEQLSRSCDEMLVSVLNHVPNAEIQGVLVTRFVANAKEVIVGALRDAQFGPVVMVGLGGVFVEIFKDVIFGIAPVTELEAMRMLESLKAFPILKGTRGDKSINFEALCRLISRASQFACEYNVQELDLNPVFCTEEDAFAGNARILIDD